MPADDRPPPQPGWTRRGFLTLAVGCVAGAGCSTISPLGRGSPGPQFGVRVDGLRVRCLYHVADGGTSTSPDGPLPAVGLLHGANTDASQWIDIGLRDAADRRVRTGACGPFVAVAPDIADHSRAAPMVLDAVIPAMRERFDSAPIVGISGISLGAAVALQCAAWRPELFRSVGLHSPAVDSNAPIGRGGWRAWVDVGEADSLATGARRLANRLRAQRIDVDEHRWPGGHDRAYWRAHLDEYLSFHVCQ